LPLLFFNLIRHHLPPTLFPYTTLFRSVAVSLTRKRHRLAPALQVEPQDLGLERVVRGRPAVRLEEPAGLEAREPFVEPALPPLVDRKSTRLNSSHLVISYAVFCLKKKI